MLLRFRVLPLVFVISLLSGCGLASKAFYSAGDKLSVIPHLILLFSVLDGDRPF